MCFVWISVTHFQARTQINTLVTVTHFQARTHINALVTATHFQARTHINTLVTATHFQARTHINALVTVTHFQARTHINALFTATHFHALTHINALFTATHFHARTHINALFTITNSHFTQTAPQTDMSCVPCCLSLKIVILRSHCLCCVSASRTYLNSREFVPILNLRVRAGNISLFLEGNLSHPDLCCLQLTVFAPTDRF
jgi:hypothetical protein